MKLTTATLLLTLATSSTPALSDTSAESSTYHLPSDSSPITIDVGPVERLGDQPVTPSTWTLDSQLVVNVVATLEIPLTAPADGASYHPLLPTQTPRGRRTTGNTMTLLWDDSDVLGAKPLAMAMPTKLNPGPVAARITLFAPVALLFHFNHTSPVTQHFSFSAFQLFSISAFQHFSTGTSAHGPVHRPVTLIP